MITEAHLEHKTVD